MAEWFVLFKRYRTPVLAVLATVMLVCSAVWSFDVPWSEVLGYLLVCVLGVAVIVAAATATVFVMKKLR
ncbi:hypothetical protein [Spongiibacter marinus]|uniref:hypothetical protein n=1 Tax=Spongiibacter marinus TaxID=354246 RepID=UPI00041ED6D7|nr:hypothetical protein [Spongiibacter marinus]